MQRYSRAGRLWICAALALSVIAPLAASSPRSDLAVLKRIASRVDERVGSVSIEASDPVPYVASQPDAPRRRW